MKTWVRLCVLGAAVLASPVFAVQKGEAVVISLNNGKTVSGTLISETSNGFLVKTATGTSMVNFADIADMQTPNAAPPPAAPSQPQYQQPPYQQPQQYRGAQPTGPSAGDFASRVSIFAKRESNSYDVTIGSRGCQTPCLLDLQPGPQRVAASGDGTVFGSVNVPEGESYIQIQHTSGVTIAGLILLSVGLAGAAAGAVFFLVSTVVAAITLAIGGGIAITGLILFIAGDKAKVTLRRGRAPFAEAPVIEPVEQPLMQWAWGT